MADYRRFGQITNAEVYLEDNSLVGIVTEFKLPKIAWKTVDIETLGQVAVYKAPTRVLEALEGEATFQFAEPDIMQRVYDPKRVNVFQIHSRADIWGAEGYGEDRSFTLVTVVGLQFIGVELEALKLGELQPVKTEFTVTRLTQRLHAEDKVLLEVDVFANRVVSGGGDIWPR